MKSPIEEFNKSIELGYKRLGLEYKPERPEGLPEENYQSSELIKLGRALKKSVMTQKEEK